MQPQPDVDVTIVGAGFSGIGAGVALRDAGIERFRILEAGDGIGGAWHWNRYPGVAVDIPSFSYQFSYRQRPDWSRVYAPGDELRDYAEDCVDHFGLRDRIQLDTTVTSATWDDEHHLWQLGFADGGGMTTRHIIGATGVFTNPKPPDIPGIDAFAGPMMHTSRWDDDVDLDGKRVALIGTGASAVQVVPSIAPRVELLTVFQRTPIWCLPKLDGPLPKTLRAAFRHVPGVQRALRLISQTYIELTFPIAAHYASVVPIVESTRKIALSHLERQVKDPATREKLTPHYGLGCKRPGFSNDYLRTFNRTNVALETAPIVSVTPDSIVTGEGARGPFDVLILATGFRVFEPGNMPAYPVRGVDGIDLEEFWAENRFQAYEGVSVPRFPNMFAILGPYAYNGSSYFTLIENQSRHIVRCLKHARAVGATRIEVTEEANRRFFEEMLSRRHRQVFFQGKCGTANSYYFDRHGDVPFRPSLTLESRWRSARFDLADYAFSSAPSRRNGDRSAPSRAARDLPAH